jgi:uncharacterized protein YdbL (DUF1318 family)
MAAYAILALALAACVTINVYFPEAAIKDLSEKIEDEVEKQAAQEAEEAAAEPDAASDDPAPQGGDLGLLDMVLGVSPAMAQDVPDAEVSNPAIRKLIESRAERIADINRLKATGAIGESNRALLEIRKLDAVGDLRERAEVQRLVKAENADREQLFREIAAAKNVEVSQLEKIRETYAATLREKARPGDWIQLPDGTWQQK